MSAVADRPVCSLLTGPNGAGKSTLYSLIDLPGAFINADEIAARISPANPELAAVQAGREVLRMIDEMFAHRRSFVYETTLSSHQSIKVISRARQSGYKTQIVFIALQSAELHIQRVRDRVAKGGHHIPDETIRRRFEMSLEKLPLAVPYCDELAIFNNSFQSGPSLRLTVRDGRVESNALSRASGFDRRIAAVLAPALSLDAEVLFID
ncbi:zeta toxin family protein [Rhizobium sp. SAFR-030]|uniref:zeta toxin family protein n=1 Tax=Rhizobium sp. SAFR-030 TaxID=3387277 RepID=UPI003F80C1EF